MLPGTRAPRSETHDPPRRWRPAATLFIVLVVALAARLEPWGSVFPRGRDGATFVADTDTYYHVLRAERIAADYPSVPWHDQGMNYPRGAEILWPPLFDQAIATLARAAAGGSPTRATVERTAAILPPVLGSLTVWLVAALASMLLGRERWVAAAILFAWLPIHVEFSVVGRPDQHVSESFLQALVMLTFVAGALVERRVWARRLWALALGAAIALSFWNWQGSALYLILLAAFAAVWHVMDAEGAVARRVHGTLAAGAGTGAILLLGSIGLWGRPGAWTSTGLAGINGIQALLTVLVALYALTLGGSGRVLRTDRGPGRRAVEVAVAALVPLAAAWLVVPGMRSAVAQGLLALSAGNPWYASIREFQAPLLGGGGIRHELAAWVPRFLPMFLMPPAALALARAWGRRIADRPSLAFVAAWGILLLVLTLLRLRFALYLAVPAVLWTALGLRELADLWGERARWRRTTGAVGAAGIAVALAPAIFYFAHGGLRPDPVHTQVIGALEWLRDRPLRDASRPAVFGEWDWGHLIQYFAGRPAVATPFGTDGGEGAMEDAAAFFLTRSPAEASRILAERRAGYLLMVDPLIHAAASAPFAPAGIRSPVSVVGHPLRGPLMSVAPEVDDLVAVRIHYDNGLSARGLPTLDRYRLVYEAAAVGPRQARLFEIVPAALLVVQAAPHDAPIRAAVGIRTNSGRETTWHASAVADGDGRASIRVPFATGENGAVAAGAYRVSCGGRETTVVVPPRAVEEGARVEVLCDSGAE